MTGTLLPPTGGAFRTDASEIVEPLLPVPELEIRGLAALLVGPDESSPTTAPLLVGTVGTQLVSCDRRRLRVAVARLRDALPRLGVARGDTICLLRLPRTSETVVAVAYAAFSALGLRVLLPMFPELGALPHWLRDTNARAVFWNRAELIRDGLDPDRAWLARASAEVASAGMSSWCLEDDLGIGRLLTTARSSLVEPHGAPLDATDVERECLILSTTGTSGAAKLVCYTERALLASCAAWQSAGLYRREVQGGRGLCLLFSHSMGVRAFWNAMWSGEALCLIPPEWFYEHPARVCALLKEMRPEHVTGGPAVYRALLELIRVYPDLKENGLDSLRTLVSSGARFDESVARRIEGALGLTLANAFGTTETMQVLSTLVAGPFTGGLGNPLPGVRVMLEPVDDASPTRHRLRIQSPFAATRCIGANGSEAVECWLETGDLVERTPDGLLYAGRERDDVVKDGFGVKVSRELIQRRYRDLGSAILHVECVPLREEPGLGAIVFLAAEGAPDAAPGTLIRDQPILRQVRSRLDARYEDLQVELDDFELRHLTVARFACVAGPPPLTVKGDIARPALEARHAALLAELTGSAVRRPGLELLDRAESLGSDATRFAAPRVGEMLHLLRLDKDFISGNGDRLTWREDGEERQAVDFTGGFGVNLLGHNHPELVAAASRFITSGAVAMADQGSAHRMEGELARRLSRLVSHTTGRSFVVRFGSTGAEAMEMALAHALLERLDALERFAVTQTRRGGGLQPRQVEAIVASARAFFHDHRPVVLSLDGAFHGHSLGARSVSGPRQRSRYASLAGIETRTLPQDAADDLDALIRDYSVALPALVEEDGQLVPGTVEVSRIIAAVAEPVRGEGGVRLSNPALLRALAGYDFPLVLDEIQCGLGRTGRMLASQGIPGAYYLLGKALGGGLAKISALLIDRPRYRKRFDEDYTSTFAGDAFSCTVGLAVLDVLERENVPARAAARGTVLRERLVAVQRDYPTVIAAIQGEGVMLGVVLDPHCAEESLLVRFAVDRERLGLLASTYLLNRWQVRILPTLSAPLTLRVEPSAWVDDQAIAQLERGLRAFADAVARRDLAELLGVLVERGVGAQVSESPATTTKGPAYDIRIAPPPHGAVRVAFLKHFVLPDREMGFIEPSLRGLSATAQRALFDRLLPLLDLKPSISFARSLFDERIWFASILLPVDPATIEALQRSGDRARVVERIQEGIALAAAHGCTVAGLGAYTSIVTDDGTSILAPSGMRIATGNTLTVAVGARRLLTACERLGVDPGVETVGIVGATGNIGRALAWRLALGERPFRRIVLVGRDLARLDAVAAELRRAAPASHPVPELSAAASLDALRQCSVIVAAAGTNETLVYPRHLKTDGRVVVADLSVPGVVSAAVRGMRQVRRVSLAGTVEVPGTPDFRLASHIRSGTAFACAGEAMLLGLAPLETSDMGLTGRIDPENVTRLERLAVRFGLLGAVGARRVGASR